MMQRNVYDLLNRVYLRESAYREAKRGFASQLAPKFNFFDYLRRDEMGVSKVLADLLDPKGPHDQGSVFLKAFKSAIGSDWIRENEDWLVATEQQANGQRRIDVYLESKDGLIGIENKPWARDQENQLSDYAEWLNDKAAHRKWLLVYICNSEPSDTSIETVAKQTLTGNENLVTLSFHELSVWLENCARLSNAIRVRLFVEEFAQFVRKEINGARDMSEQRLVMDEITKSDESLEAAFRIHGAIKQVQSELLEKLRTDLNQQIRSSHPGWEVMWDKRLENGTWNACVGFGIKFAKSHDKYLRFEFEGSGLLSTFWGLRRESGQVTHDKDLWDDIGDVMRDACGAGKSSAWWPWYSIVPDAQFPDNFKHWGTSEAPWIDIREDAFAQKFLGLAARIEDAFKKGGNLHLLAPASEARV